MVSWLSLHRGGYDLRTPLLIERHPSYLNAETSANKTEAILLFRGSKSRLPELDRHIWMLYYPSTVLFDCYLHHHEDLPVLKAGPSAPSITQHELNTARAIAHDKVAEHFYSKALLPICAAAVFIEDEHTGLSEITSRLASWTHLASGSACFRFRPIVLIVTSKCSMSSRRIEEDIVAKLLQHHNPCREMSFGMARSSFRSCFDRVVLVQPTAAGTLASNVREWSTQVREIGQSTKISTTNFKLLLFSVCKQFAANSNRSFCFEQACQRQPPGNILTLQVQRLVELASEQPSVRENAINIISYALRIYTHQYGPNFAQRAGLPAVVSRNSSSEWFDESYSDVLADAKYKTIRNAIKRKFIELNNLDVLPYPVVVDDKIITHLKGSCLSCLSHCPSAVLPCGHELCDSCLCIYGKLSAAYTCHFVLERCPYCQQDINFKRQPRPRAAGLRVLSLTGKVSDARDVAQFLKQLRGNLCGRLDDYFDIVICGGIGVFFAVMLFCQRSTIEDCIHHLPRLDRIAFSKTELIFGRSLRFPRDCLKSATLYITEHPLHHGTPVGSRLRTPGQWLQAKRGKSTHSGLSDETMLRILYSEKVDVLARNDSYTPEIVNSTAKALLASLFYIESHTHPVFNTGSRIYLPITILCRLAGTQHFKNIAMKLRRQNTRLYVQGDEPVQTFVLINEQTWEDILKGKPFMRNAYIGLSSPSGLVKIMIDDCASSNTITVYSGPANAIHVREQHNSTKTTLQEQINLLEESLTTLV